MNRTSPYITATIGILLIIFSCASPERTTGPTSECRTRVDHDELAWKIFDIRLKSEMISHRRLGDFVSKKLDNLDEFFDLRALLREFPLLKLKDGAALHYGYNGSPMWDGAGYVFIIEDGKPVRLSAPEVYKKYISFEKCSEGYFQYVLFREELDLLTLKQHANYAQSWFVPSRESFKRICSAKTGPLHISGAERWYGSLLPAHPGENGRHRTFWRKFTCSFRSYAPKITVEGERAHIEFHRFTPFGGIYQSEYLMDTVTGTLFQESGQWAFPIYRKGEFIIPYHCGVMF